MATFPIDIWTLYNNSAHQIICEGWHAIHMWKKTLV